MEKTIVERVTTMLSHAMLPKSFWGEALMIVIYLINLFPSTPLNGDVPNRFQIGKDVSFNHLNMFGCRAFFHVPKDERPKFDSKSKECIFLGYGNEEFRYRLRDHIEKQIIRSKDDVFFEDQNIEDVHNGVKRVISKEHIINLEAIPPLEYYGRDETKDVRYA